MKKKAIKFIGIQIAVILAVFLTQMVMVFFSQNRILVILPKDDQKSFYGLYVSAKADYLTCDEQLEQFKQLRDEKNADILR